MIGRSIPGDMIGGSVLDVIGRSILGDIMDKSTPVDTTSRRFIIGDVIGRSVGLVLMCHLVERWVVERTESITTHPLVERWTKDRVETIIIPIKRKWSKLCRKWCLARYF